MRLLISSLLLTSASSAARSSSSHDVPRRLAFATDRKLQDSPTMEEICAASLVAIELTYPRLVSELDCTCVPDGSTYVHTCTSCLLCRDGNCATLSFRDVLDPAVNPNSFYTDISDCVTWLSGEHTGRFCSSVSVATGDTSFTVDGNACTTTRSNCGTSSDGKQIVDFNLDCSAVLAGTDVVDLCADTFGDLSDTKLKSGLIFLREKNKCYATDQPSVTPVVGPAPSPVTSPTSSVTGAVSTPTGTGSPTSGGAVVASFVSASIALLWTALSV